MLNYLTKAAIIVTALTVAGAVAYAELNGASRGSAEPLVGSEGRAVDFLVREVPAWSKSNGCFSCHNNGDGARALYAASRKGYSIDEAVLADTTMWLKQPKRWDENKGDPGFGDKHLASVQFSASLIAALNAGYIRDDTPLEEAVRRLIADQGPDGAWRITPETAIGSPVTYGTQLATQMAQKALRETKVPAARMAIERATRWLSALTPASTFTAATLLLASGSGVGISRATQEKCVQMIASSQTQDGGWGPFKDSPPEPFDTALVLLALAPLRKDAGIESSIAAGRRFLLAHQEDDGGWAATTRPPGGESYAQRISTAGWATLALLETR